MAEYTHNRESANDAVLEGSPVGSGIEKLMVTASAFEDTMTGLLKELELHVDEQVKSQRNWPRNPSASAMLSNASNAFEPRGLRASCLRFPGNVLGKFTNSFAPPGAHVSIWQSSIWQSVGPS